MPTIVAPKANAALPNSDCLNVTPSDTDDLSASAIAIGLLIGGTAGNLKVNTAAGTTIVIPSAVLTAIIANGGWFPVRVTRVWSTGTTGTMTIVAVF
jgi:hypothetical protein